MITTWSRTVGFPYQLCPHNVSYAVNNGHLTIAVGPSEKCQKRTNSEVEASTGYEQRQAQKDPPCECRLGGPNFLEKREQCHGAATNWAGCAR
jgi:hypothetical protein